MCFVFYVFYDVISFTSYQIGPIVGMFYTICKVNKWDVTNVGGMLEV